MKFDEICRLYLLHVVFVVLSPFQSHHHTHTMLLMEYVEFRAVVKDAGKVAVKVDSTPQSLFGDITHATYSCGLDCEKQEHWTEPDNHCTVYLAGLR